MKIAGAEGEKGRAEQAPLASPSMALWIASMHSFSTWSVAAIIVERLDGPMDVLREVRLFQNCPEERVSKPRESRRELAEETPTTTRSGSASCAVKRGVHLRHRGQNGDGALEDELAWREDGIHHRVASLQRGCQERGARIGQ